MTTAPAPPQFRPAQGFVLLVVVVVATTLSFWPTVRDLSAFWWVNEDYSVGSLVLPVWLWLIWQARHRLRAHMFQPSIIGLALLIASQFLRFFALIYGYGFLERLAMVSSLVSVVIMLAGLRVFRALLWEHVFLLLLIPLPNRVHNLIAMPLQSWATGIGQFGLELLGYFVKREGNVLTVNEDTTVLVAEACSGLRMLTAFIFVAAVLCFLVSRPTWQRVALLCLSIPTAVVMNGLRVTATAMYFDVEPSASARSQFHDMAGLVMMPVAVAVLLGILRLFEMIFIADPEPKQKGDADSTTSVRSVSHG